MRDTDSIILQDFIWWKRLSNIWWAAPVQWGDSLSSFHRWTGIKVQKVNCWALLVSLGHSKVWKAPLLCESNTRSFHNEDGIRVRSKEPVSQRFSLSSPHKWRLNSSRWGERTDTTTTDCRALWYNGKSPWQHDKTYHLCCLFHIGVCHNFISLSSSLCTRQFSLSSTTWDRPVEGSVPFCRAAPMWSEDCRTLFSALMYPIMQGAYNSRYPAK